MSDTALFILHGFIGAVIAVLVKAYSWRYLKSWSAVRYYVLGALSGYVYYWLHSEYSFPNAVMSIVAGYFASDFLESFLQQVKKRLGG